jgi:nucleolar protein 56
MNFKELRELNLTETKRKIKNSLTDDLLIIQGIHLIDELSKVRNRLYEGFCEWYGYYFPELIGKEGFIEVYDMDRESLMRKIKVSETMGSELSKEDKESLFLIGSEIKELDKLLLKEEAYLDTMMEKNCKHLKKVAGVLIGARLVKLAGGLRELAFMPSSTIQILGAEKALFRHLRGKSLPPKHGVIYHHELLKEAENKGKAARQLAGKISIAIKQDYFGK